MSNENKVLISVATPRMIWGDTLKSLVEMAKYMGDKVDFKIVVGCEIGAARNQAVRATLAGGYKGLCMIDSDQTFPPNALQVLIDANKDIISHNIRASRQDCLCHGYWQPNIYQQQAFTDYPEDSIWEIGWSGNGFILIKREVLEKIADPWFKFDYVKDEQGRDFRLHSDFYFSLKYREAGFKAWCCSKVKVGHMSIIERFPPNSYEVK